MPVVIFTQSDCKPHTKTHFNLYLFWPELSSLQYVLEVVSDDVGLLEEQTHRVGQLVILANLWTLQLRS